MIIAPTLRVVALFWTLCVLLTTQSVENCIATLERAERYFPTIVPTLRALRSNSHVIIAPTLRVVALFWTLCVLLTTQGVENCIPTQSGMTPE
ncbi:hypothetical protein, partial [Pseudomonas amygdali]